MNLNKIILVGRAGKDPEVKYMEDGSAVANFTLAVNRPTKSKDEPPDWFDLELWNKTAEVAANYVKKGGLIGIEGQLKLDTWNDRTSGVGRSKPVIRVDRLDLLGSKKDNDGGGYQDANTAYGDEF